MALLSVKLNEFIAGTVSPGSSYFSKCTIKLQPFIFHFTIYHERKNVISLYPQNIWAHILEQCRTEKEQALVNKLNGLKGSNSFLVHPLEDFFKFISEGKHVPVSY